MVIFLKPDYIPQCEQEMESVFVSKKSQKPDLLSVIHSLKSVNTDDTICVGLHV